MLIVFVAGITRTENRAGCITVGVLLHYLILVTFMWMAAEAVLLIQKLVIVFTKGSVKYLIIMSVICWGESMHGWCMDTVTHALICYTIYTEYNIAAPVIPVVIPVAINPEFLITPPNETIVSPGL